ncbi:cell envelope integrity protein CreD [Desulfoluna spongiiphila]|uniref:Inner membrane protein n=1 Tax=Desulfoluna spongiiphila TaxID=419481 RepID=A0A1G5H188_9BACT|nr:cell envelope integrity protein CreD [Desulfoluna spongiiphila]SCY57130.1 inner membrane protein [Desulfoluna spongiiphila]
MNALFLKKTGIIAVLVVVMFVPLTAIKSLVTERRTRGMEAAREVSKTWGGEQTVTGPVLTIPFVDQENATRYVHFMPEALEASGKLVPEKRRRGIYEVVVYKSEITLKGTFALPSFFESEPAVDRILWDKAFLSAGISQLQGVQSKARFLWQDEPCRIRHGKTPGAPINGLHASVLLENSALGRALHAQGSPDDSVHPFSFEIYLPLQGAGRLNVTPVGNTNIVDLSSTWEHPGFQGRYFPTSREISPDGFTAHWDVTNYDGLLARAWTSGKEHAFISSSTLDPLSFGVQLVQPVDFYTKSERSVKYALVIITITFLTFFIFEVVKKSRIHPMHYILVGISLSLFYLLLLSLSEHLGFSCAYLIAGVASISSIGFYSAGFLSGAKDSVIVSMLLSVLFGAFYVILQLENLSLVLGSAGLFLILVAIMVITRKVDWYESFGGVDSLE